MHGLKEKLEDHLGATESGQWEKGKERVGEDRGGERGLERRGERTETTF